MKAENLNTAIQEATRFLERAKTLQQNGEVYYDHFVGGAETAAVRRSSLDLTKALSQLRKV